MHHVWMRGQKLIGFRHINSSWYRQKETLPLRWNVKKFSELFWSESDWWLSIRSKIKDQILGQERRDRKGTLPLPFSFLFSSIRSSLHCSYLCNTHGDREMLKEEILFSCFLQPLPSQIWTHDSTFQPLEVPSGPCLS